MARVTGWAFLLGSVVLFSGCGSESGDAPVQNIINALTTAAEQLNNIHTRMAQATKLKANLDSAATEADKKSAKEELEKKLNEVFGGIDDFKKQSEKLLAELRRVEKKPLTVTEEEKKAIAEKNQGKLRDALEQLSKERNELNKVMARIKSGKELEEKTIQDLEQKIREAEGEFENLARR